MYFTFSEEVFLWFKVNFDAIFFPQYFKHVLFVFLCCRPEMVVGWYHSHPGFGCWLSGVDINTQQVITFPYSTLSLLKDIA